MAHPKRILVISDFKEESPHSVRIERRRWPKGFLRLGHDVQTFSYRNILTQFNPFSGKYFRRFMPDFVRKRADTALSDIAKVYHPDIIFLGGMKYLTPQTIDMLREAAPGAVLAGRDNDAWPERKPDRIAVAKKLDVMTVTSAGEFLKTYKRAGVPRCAFIANPCDPDIQYRYEVGEEWESDIVFTGRAGHKRSTGVEEKDRVRLLVKLSQQPNARLYGCFDKPRIDGIETFWAMAGAKIALSINAINSERLYHSDRFINCIACGPLTIAKRVPDTELLFEDKKHVRYFDSNEEFFELTEWYLKHEDERRKIAAAGTEHAHREYNCAHIAQLTLDFIEKGDYDAPWKAIL